MKTKKIQGFGLGHTLECSTIFKPTTPNTLNKISEITNSNSVRPFNTITIFDEYKLQTKNFRAIKPNKQVGKVVGNTVVKKRNNVLRDTYRKIEGNNNLKTAIPKINYKDFEGGHKRPRSAARFNNGNGETSFKDVFRMYKPQFLNITARSRMRIYSTLKIDVNELQKYQNQSFSIKPRPQSASKNHSLNSTVNYSETQWKLNTIRSK